MVRGRTVHTEYEIAALDVTCADSQNRAQRRRALLGSVGSSIGCSLLLVAYVFASECLQLSERNDRFMVHLGVEVLTVAATYAALALAVGLVIGLVVRAPRWQYLGVAAIYYVVLSLKLFSQDVSLLADPVIGTGVVVGSIGLFTLVEYLVGRFSLTWAAPLLVVVAYLNVGARVGQVWTAAGGSLLHVVLSPRTLLVCASCGLLLIAAVFALSKLENRRAQRTFHTAVLATFAVAIAVANRGHADRRAFSEHASATDVPDVYVVSFDALRRDSFEAFTRSHPDSHFAEVLTHGVAFTNIVADGSSTYPILSNNTYAGARHGDCASSLPHSLRDRGYATAMFLGRAGKRFDGAACYDEFYSGEGDVLSSQFKLLAVMGQLWGSGIAAQRARMIRSPVLVGELAGALQRMAAQPAFAYMHFLDFHHPYVPLARDHDDGYVARLRAFMQRCLASSCDPSDPTTARSIQDARRGYEEVFVQADALVGDVLAIARARHRDFIFILTADHGELFGEHGGFIHGGGFVHELLNVPFVVYDSRASAHLRRCDLLVGSEALRATLLGETYAKHDTVAISSALGRAVIDGGNGRIRYEIDPKNRAVAGTWRNVHRDLRGDDDYPIDRCDPIAGR